MYGKMIVFELLSSKWKPQVSDYAEQKSLKIQDYIYARKMTLHPKGWSNQYVCEISAMSAHWGLNHHWFLEFILLLLGKQRRF